MSDRTGIDLLAPWSLEGEFALPGHAELPGTIRYDMERLELSTRGAMRSRGDHASVIHGRTDQGAVTLLQSSWFGQRYATHGSSQTWRARTMLLGGWHTTRTRYNRVWLGFRDLAEWISHGGLDWTRPTDGSHPTIAIKAWNETLANVGLRRITGDSLQPYKVSRTRAEIAFRPLISIEYRQPVTLDELMHDAHRMRELLSLLTGATVTLEDIRAKPVGRPARGAQKTVWIVEAGRGWTSDLAKAWHLIDFSELKPVAKTVFSRWFAGRDLDRTALDLYFAARHFEDLPLELRYLCILQCLERHHRRYHYGRYMSPAAYQQVRAAITAAIPKALVSQSHAQALANRVAFGNEKSLRNRIKDLCESLPDEFFEMFGRTAKRLPGELADIRNDLTHYQTNAKRTAALARLPDATRIALALSSALFLNRLGFEAPQIVRGLSRHGWAVPFMGRMPHGRDDSRAGRVSIWTAPPLDAETWHRFRYDEMMSVLGLRKLDQGRVDDSVIRSRRGLRLWMNARGLDACVSAIKANTALRFPFRVIVIKELNYTRNSAIPGTVPLSFVGVFDLPTSRIRRRRRRRAPRLRSTKTR